MRCPEVSRGVPRHIHLSIYLSLYLSIYLLYIYTHVYTHVHTYIHTSWRMRHIMYTHVSNACGVAHGLAQVYLYIEIYTTHSTQHIPTCI